MLRRRLATRFLSSSPSPPSSRGKEAYEELTKLTDPAKRILATAAIHAEYAETVKPFYVEMRALHARMNAAAVPLMQKRREVLSGGPIPSLDEMKKLLGEESFEGLRLHVVGAAAAAKQAPTLNGIFWRDTFAQIGDLEDDKIVTEKDCGMLEHLLDVRCRFTVDKKNVETVLFEFEFGETAPLSGRKTIRALFKKDAPTGIVKSSQCDPLTFVSKESDPRYKRIGKKRKGETPRYVKVKSFFHIFNTIEDFTKPHYDEEDDEVSTDDDDMYEDDAYVPWDQHENTAFIISQLQDNYIANAANSFLLYHGDSASAANGEMPEMTFEQLKERYKEYGDPKDLLGADEYDFDQGPRHQKKKTKKKPSSSA